ncbi:uncharacterized protein LOC122260495 [Penaeus japonicus]|uniref:uncharacterized protein LOC122260495 n=1 Tax=Penaeus japonicus TaxID=27405 RepID=UPI001C70C690|nr:uncharacterized protein LOC122260495 [Penaeus japonicus]
MPYLPVILMVALTGVPLATPLTCTSAGVFCSSCTSISVCNGPGAEGSEVSCQDTQLCGVSGSLASCYEKDAPEAGSCACPTDAGFLADPYDPRKFVMCLPDGSQVSSSCQEWEVFDAVGKACGLATTTTTPEPIVCVGVGFFKLTCTSYYACAAPGEQAQVFECDTGDLYDEVAAKCVSPEDFRPPAFVCGCDDGAFADTVDCSRFHICVSGSAVGEPLSCPDGHVFDGDRGFCVAGECSVNECLDAIRTLGASARM